MRPGEVWASPESLALDGQGQFQHLQLAPRCYGSAASDLKIFISFEAMVMATVMAMVMALVMAMVMATAMVMAMVLDGF